MGKTLTTWRMLAVLFRALGRMQSRSVVERERLQYGALDVHLPNRHAARLRQLGDEMLALDQPTKRLW